jgi:2,4-dichlorophenol 6-monooxygenase
MRVIEVPVLIIGAGGSGLSASNFLADLGVESLLIERHPEPSSLPRAHYLNQRTMEIYRQHGLADAVYEKATPPENMSKALWYTSLGGDDPLDGVKLCEADAMGGGAMKPLYDMKGVTRPANLHQIWLEPILRRIAEERNPDRVLFNHEFVSLAQDDQGVDALVRNRETGEELTVRTQYVLGADGGKAVGPSLGVAMIGETNMQDLVAVHIVADFSRYLDDDSAVMYYIVRPRQVAKVQGAQFVGAILATGPTRWGRHSEEWVVAFGYGINDPERHNEEVLPRVRDLLQVDVPIEVKKVSHWTLGRVTADKFQVGRVFLVGDAAHQHTPGGGLGLNSGIQDAHNIAWKLAMVLKGQAPASLLDTYEAERRPVVERNSEWSMFVIFNNHILQAAMGMVHGASAEFNEAMFTRLLAQTEDGASRRARLNEVVQVRRSEYAAHDMEMGFQYRKGGVVDDGLPWPERDPMGHVYTPSSHPGCRVPHAWLHQDGKAVSTHDLIPMGGFLLLAGKDGGAWCAAARKLAAERGLKLHAVRVADDGDASDPSGAWAGVCGIGAGGALLVRPDSHVGFRAQALGGDPCADLGKALKTIIGR